MTIEGNIAALNQLRIDQLCGDLSHLPPEKAEAIRKRVVEKYKRNVIVGACLSPDDVKWTTDQMKEI